MKKTTFKSRQQARAMVLQALYSWQVSGGSIIDIGHFVLSEQSDQVIDESYFKTSLEAITKKAAELDRSFEPFITRPIEKLDPIELNVLRIAAYEFKYHPEIPFRVVMNEALELTKQFGGTDGHKFINGVIDKLARTLRAKECK